MPEQSANGFTASEASKTAPRWHQAVLRGLEEVPEIAARIEATMAAAGYPFRDCFGVRLAVEEALVNAVKHGHRGDRSRLVHIRYGVGPSKVLVEVEDQGDGFDRRQVADPLTPENINRTSGRGLLLMEAYSTWVRRNKLGNRVTLCRKRSGYGADAGVLLVSWEEASPASSHFASQLQGAQVLCAKSSLPWT